KRFEPRRGNPPGGTRQIRRTPWKPWFPSQRRAKPETSGRCREQTAGTYSRNGQGEGVLQTTNAEGGGESRSGTKIPRPRGRAGSTPASGTNPGRLPEPRQPQSAIQ